MLRDYYVLTKPGIIRGNVMTSIAGYLLAARGHVSVWPLVGVVVGTTLVIAGACVFNNIIDRGIDKKMQRTQKRAMVKGSINTTIAWTYGSVLAIIGFIVLIWLTNPLTTLLGAIGIVSYVVLYGIAKRRSVHGTLVGTIPGAMPLVSGYTAASGQLDLGAGILFLIMVLWQMPHFYGIGIFRLKDYQAAKLPIMPVKKGIHTTKLQIIYYVIGFGIACALLTVLGYAGITFIAVMSLLSLYWLWLGYKGWQTKDDTAWARGMFGFSLVTLLVLSFMLSVESFLP